jgi:hypothetical protein
MPSAAAFREEEDKERQREEFVGMSAGLKKVQIPLARPFEVAYIRRPFSRSRDRIALSRLTT